MSLQTSYLYEVLTPESLRATAKKMCKVLRQHKKDFDAVAFRGMSGAMIGPLVAMVLNKKMLAVRKPESCHSPYIVEGDLSAERYVIVDDLICTGNTVKVISSDIKIAVQKRDCSLNPVCVGLVLYQQHQMYFNKGEDKVGGPFNKIKELNNALGDTDYFAYGLGE